MRTPPTGGVSNLGGRERWVFQIAWTTRKVGLPEPRRMDCSPSGIFITLSRNTLGAS